ncbi:DUF6157 family protein [Metabacillus arenae]|uniref:Uncharacterized protein n=1 Tax=Metabacillus arenae TaxID=2771434 RepID=A0A926NM99_9BACI|nr:DUF6157 family protein [Metabacillus arenae]MBD1380622.1 hypothetical protein [Metabacillus arenae]
MKDNNYYQTFITVAPDCPVLEGLIPPARKKGPTKPLIEYELLSKSPYTYTQEDLLFEVYIRHKAIPEEELEARGAQIKDEFFQKPQACLRASMLPKKYGWGLHFDEAGKIALYSVNSPEYQGFQKNKDDKLSVLSAMRSSRKHS